MTIETITFMTVSVILPGSRWIKIAFHKWEELTGILGVDKHYGKRKHLEKLNSFVCLVRRLFLLRNCSV
jgi:hypothetical protein